MNDITMILIATFAVYGFYAMLYEIRGFFTRFARGRKIDKGEENEYNNTNDS